MKTTLDLPDELMRAVKVRVAEENVKLQEVVANLLRLGLSAASKERQTVRHRVKFPLVECPRPAKPGEELTPERVAAILAHGELATLGAGSPVVSAPSQKDP